MQGLELPVPKATQRAAAEAKAKFEASPAGKAAAAAAAAAAGVVRRTKNCNVILCVVNLCVST